MVLASFHELRIRASARAEPLPLAVAAAEDLEVLTALSQAAALGLAAPLLVGQAAKITELAEHVGLEPGEIIDQPDAGRAALEAVGLVSSGRAGALMKGLINTSDFMRAVLDKEVGLRTAKRLSHLAALERPGEGRLLFLSDSAVNPAPDLDAKKDILLNALALMRQLEYSRPRVALLAANEQINPKIPATTDARALVEYFSNDHSISGFFEGPVALDVAISPEAARHKGLDSRISGRTDLFLAPNIEAGNIFVKSLLHWGGASMAGLVLGAAAPIILTSRSDTPEGKLNSIALAALASGPAGHQAG